LALAEKLIVTAPLPLAWMGDCAGTDHVHVDVHEAVQKMSAVFHGRTMERVFPHGSCALLAHIVTLCRGTGHQMHEAADGNLVIGMRQHMNMVARHAV